MPTSLSIRAILAARARGRSARGGASDRRGLREVGRSGTGEGVESEGWSGRSNNASDAETEDDGMPTREQGGRYDMLTASL